MELVDVALDETLELEADELTLELVAEVEVDAVVDTEEVVSPKQLLALTICQTQFPFLQTGFVNPSQKSEQLHSASHARTSTGFGVPQSAATPQRTVGGPGSWAKSQEVMPPVPPRPPLSVLPCPQDATAAATQQATMAHRPNRGGRGRVRSVFGQSMVASYRTRARTSRPRGFGVRFPPLHRSSSWISSVRSCFGPKLGPCAASSFATASLPT